MAKKARKRGPREFTVTILCEWCGEHRETSRQDTKTCGDRCRARLKFFTDYLGYPPDSIQGPVTGQQAVDFELHRLITQEQDRRKVVEAERRAYLARRAAPTE